MPLVFISYAHAEPAEAGLARLIAERLRRDGAELFFDERLRTGQDWNQEIERALDACDAFCPLLSATSLASPMVQNEIARVGERRRRHDAPAIWPIRCRHDGRLPYDVGAHLRRIQYLTWQGEADTAFTLDELLDRWRELRDGPQPEPLPPALCTLPGRIADFTGREPEIADLIAALCREDRRAAVSAIGGMGGAGKTTLAIEAAWRMAGRFPDGILYIDMLGFGTAPPLTPAQALAAVIEQLEPTAKLPDRPDQLLPLYRRLLAGRKLLLLLDNARETAQVAGLVPPQPVALLVTSRHQIFLDGATQLNLDIMPPEVARKLLREIIAGRDATDEELDALAERCGRLPLALRAAGAYLRIRAGLEVGDYVELLSKERQRLDHLKVRQANRDVRATLNLSAALLNADDPELAARWRQLAVFPAPFRPDAAATVWDVSPSGSARTLDELVARSLLVFEHENHCYRMHDLVRDVADEALDDGARQIAAFRHSVHYYMLLRRADNLFRAGRAGIKDGLKLFDEEQTNLVFGQAWAARNHSHLRVAARLAFSYTDAGIDILNLRKSPRERIDWLQTAVAACRVTNDRLSEAAAIGNLGNAWLDLEEPEMAIEMFEERLRIAREIGDRPGECAGLGSLGMALGHVGKPREAIRVLKNQLVIARDIGERRSEGNALGNIGQILLTMNREKYAVPFFRKA